MTRESAIKWERVIKAFQEGKTIQYFNRDGYWQDVYDPSFSGDDYRIKPTKKIDVATDRLYNNACYCTNITDYEIELTKDSIKAILKDVYGDE